MKLINRVIGSALLLALTSAYGGTALSDTHPEEAYPDNLRLMVSPGPDAALIEEVQRKLRERGFDAGPVDGAYGTKTQAALAQFQLAQSLPATGMLDDDTLRELGVQRPGTAGSCDALFGAEKERCLHEGGTVEAALK